MESCCPSIRTRVENHKRAHVCIWWQAALRRLAYSEAGQTLASVNEWEASEAYLKAGIHREGASKNPAVTCCVNILGKDKGTQFSSSAEKKLPTSWDSSTDKDSLFNLPAN